jgi:hypothetical protein
MNDTELCNACGYHVAIDGTVMFLDDDLDNTTFWLSASDCVKDNRLRLSVAQKRKIITWLCYDVPLEAIAEYFNLSVAILKINMGLKNEIL